jgi:hypothetical protein
MEEIQETCITVTIGITGTGRIVRRRDTEIRQKTAAMLGQLAGTLAKAAEDHIEETRRAMAACGTEALEKFEFGLREGRSGATIEGVTATHLAPVETTDRRGFFGGD